MVHSEDLVDPNGWSLRILFIDSGGYNIHTKFMYCYNPLGLCLEIIALINFVRILYPCNQSYCMLFTN